MSNLKRGSGETFSQNGERPSKTIKTIRAAINQVSDQIQLVTKEIDQIKSNINTLDTDIFDDGYSTEEYDPCFDQVYCEHNSYDPDLDMNKFDKLEPDIDMLISLGNSYHCTNRLEHRGINLQILKRLVSPLLELKHMIGMKEVKKAVVDHIIFALNKMREENICGICTACISDVDAKCTNDKQDMMHTVITGPPGVGKTDLGQILGKIYTAMGLLSKGTFNIAKRSDLVAKFLGQTAIKTQNFIDKCQGGILFIDEAYSLGNSEGRDSFSKECIDTLNQNLTEKRDFLCIIAGYKDDLESCFFATNKGLARRFSFRYDITGYSSDELCQIFESKLKKEGWKIQEGIDIQSFFKKNKALFPYFGGDIETLFFACRLIHNRRHFLSANYPGKIIQEKDIQVGFDAFVENRKSKKAIDQIISSMYI